MEELIAQFPTKDNQLEAQYRSFIYQPERVSLNSRQSITGTQPVALQFLDSDYYYTFSCELKTPLLGVKSVELIRVSIPNAVPNIPNNEACFYYYKIPADPTTNLPNYAAISPATMHIVRLLPMPPYSPDNYANPNQYGWNATFGDYQSLVDQLNLAAQNDPNAAAITFYEANDVEFYYDQQRNRIGFRGLNTKSPAGDPENYYLPVGYKDPNIAVVQAGIRTALADPVGILFPTNGNNTLNKRLGLQWDGLYQTPVTPPSVPNPDGSIGWQMLAARTAPKPNFTGLPWTDYLPNYTAESFADLVNTANIFIYCDIVGGSTQDTNTDERLLAVVPAQASNLGVIFGESKISCLLTKVSQTIFSMTFTLRTDTGSAFYLPKSAYVNLELKISY